MAIAEKSRKEDADLKKKFNFKIPHCHKLLTIEFMW